MSITIRRAIPEDCPRLMELIKELARNMRKHRRITVTMDHFINSGFGNNPVWWSFVAERERDHSWIRPLLYPLFHLERTGHVPGRYHCYRKSPGPWYWPITIWPVDRRSPGKKFNRIIWQLLEWNEPAINFYRKYNADFDGEWLNASIYIN